MTYQDVIERRRAFIIPGFEADYTTLAEVGLEGDWVTPYQISSCATTGPALVALHWCDVNSLQRNMDDAQRLGYFPRITFNKVLNQALALTGVTRADIYMTQAFHLLPRHSMSQKVPPAHIDASFNQITKYEVQGRQVIALGKDAGLACRRTAVPHIEVCHPSARGRSYADKAREIATALKASIQRRKWSGR